MSPRCVDSHGNTAPCQTPISVSQAMKYAYDAGFRGENLITITSIALAESGGKLIPNQQELGGSSHYGILQIDPYQNGVSYSGTLDPAQAFKDAYKISNGGTNYKPWQTYTNGMYKTFINFVRVNAGLVPGQGQNAPGQAFGPAEQQGINAVTSGLGSGFGQLGNAIGNFTSAITSFMTRALFVIVGIIVIAIGILVITSGEEKKVINVAQEVPE